MKPQPSRFHNNNEYFGSPQVYGWVALYQLGDLSARPDFELPEHEQVCYEITAVISGKGWFSTNGDRYEVQEGDIYIAAPGEQHAGGADRQDPYRYCYLGFTFAGGPDSPEGRRYQPIRQVMEGRPLPCARDAFQIKQLFFRLLQEYMGSDLYSQDMIGAYIQQIITLAYRNFMPLGTGVYAPSKLGPGVADLVYSCTRYIDSKLPTIRSLGEIAEAVGYSYSYVSHIFSQEMGISLRAYVASRKWRWVMDRLRTGSMPITEAAYELQYQSVTAFSKAFRKAVGMSPSEYMAQHGRRTE